jgi:hypothetical protein
MKTVKIRALAFPSAHEAREHAAVEHTKAVLLEGKPFVVWEDDCVRLAAAGVSFAYLCEHMGQIMSVPVN